MPRVRAKFRMSCRLRIFPPKHPNTNHGQLTDLPVALFSKPLRTSLNRRVAAGDGGSIINISSIASLQPSPHAEPYGAAKAGLNALTESFAWAFGPKVRVNAIAAGPFLTDISKAWDMEAFAARAASTIPLQRGGEPEEIVGAALYFASAASSYTTGTVLRVDGGSRMG